MTLDIGPVTSDLWPALETLFGPQGACYGRWCSYFRLAPKQRDELSRDEKKQHLKQAAEAQIPPGLIALDDGVPVGWVQVTPRAHLPRWNTPRTVSRPLEGDDPSDPGLWVISCFFIQFKRRGQGLSHVLVDASVAHARDNGARIIEACPVEHARHSRSVGLLSGSVRVFEKAGFEVAAERKPGRPLMRKVLA